MRFLWPVIFALTGCVSDNVVRSTGYRDHPPSFQDGLADDALNWNALPKFDPERVDRRQDLMPGRQVNASGAVLRLDMPPWSSDSPGEDVVLQRTYAEACARPTPDERTLLPSVHLIAAKAAEFDERLSVALDERLFKAQLDFVHRLHERIDPRSEAGSYLAAALELERPGRGVEVSRGVAAYVHTLRTSASELFGSEVRADDIGRYQRLRFQRLLQMTFDLGADVPTGLCAALTGPMRSDYQTVTAFDNNLKGPGRCGSLLAPGDAVDRSVAVFPAKKSVESVMFENLFLGRMTKEEEFRKLMIRADRKETPNFPPSPSSGWTGYRVYALEALTFPGRGPESERLLESCRYKSRLLGRLPAPTTRDKSFHLGPPWKEQSHEIKPGFTLGASLKPRLRIEPNPSYYLRAARGYRFVGEYLKTTKGDDRLEQMKPELDEIRNLFYGLYIVSAEDIGLRSEVTPGEADVEKCYAAALGWLAHPFGEGWPESDVRRFAPLAADSESEGSAAWATLGVRLAPLDVEYVIPFQVRLATGGEWHFEKSLSSAAAHYMIAVPETAILGPREGALLSEVDLRDACDRERTRPRILAALARRAGQMQRTGRPADSISATASDGR